MTSNDQFRPDAPPALDSAAYTAAFNEVKEFGSATSATRTQDQTDIAFFWANGAGTATPIGHLNLMAQVIAQQESNTLEQNARLFAALNVALADAVISCWDAKYEFNFWRPVTGIREADLDGNPDTIADPTWNSLIGSPPFPAYTSGHSAVSGAAAVVLADHFGTDDISFALDSQHPTLPASRSYTSISQATDESAISRLYGGIHWSFDNNVGLDAGAALGQYVVANFLRRVTQMPAAGVVNGELVVIGTDRSDLLDIERSGGALVVWANGTRLGTFNQPITNIVMDGRDGSDLLRVSHTIHTDAEIYGGAGNDLIFGGSGADRIFGEDGHDILFGLGGADHLDGGAGDDLLFGGSGLDVLIGGPGRNFLFS
jgi:hypothetical protein